MQTLSRQAKKNTRAKSLSIAFLGALLVTVGLLWLMQHLVTQSSSGPELTSTFHLVDFIRLAKVEKTKTRQRKPLKPKKRQQPSKQVLNNVFPSTLELAQNSLTKINYEKGLAFSPQLVSLAQSEGDFLPIVKIAPIYPPRALNRGAEGECIVEFTVTADGNVIGAAPVPGKCDPLFSAASLRAVKKFKYKPRVKNGIPVSVTAIKNKFTYRLNE